MQGIIYWLAAIGFAVALLALAVVIVRLVVALLLGILGGIYDAFAGTNGPANAYTPAEDQSALAESRLILACSGDRDLAERLIKYELSRLRHLTRLEAVTTAAERIWRDRIG